MPISYIGVYSDSYPAYVMAPAPTITSFSPANGAIGATVTITGTNLSAATLVKLNGVSVSFTVLSGTQVTFVVPSGSTTGPIAVTTSGGTATSSTNFTVNVAATGEQMILEGDSQYNGGFSYMLGVAYPQFGLISGGMRSNCVSGQRSTDLLTATISGYAGLRARLQGQRDPAKARHAAMIYIGTNDIALDKRPAADIEATLKSICTICREEGFDTFVGTVTSLRSSAVGTTLEQQAADVIRTTLNARLRAYGTDITDGIGASIILDFGSIPQLGQYASGLNTTYFLDGLHWAEPAKDLVRDMQDEAITRWLAAETGFTITRAPLATEFRLPVTGAVVIGSTLDRTVSGDGWDASGGALKYGFGPMLGTEPTGTLRGETAFTYASAKAGYFIRLSEGGTGATGYVTGFAGMLADTAAITPFGGGGVLGAAINTNDSLLRTCRLVLTDTQLIMYVQDTVLYTHTLTTSQRNNNLYVLIGISKAAGEITDVLYSGTYPVLTP